MDKFKTYSELVALYGVRKMAIDLFGENEKGNPERKDYHRVYKWLENDTLPSTHWPKLIIKAKSRGIKITLKNLLELQENRV